MDWTEDIGGIRFRLVRKKDSPEDVILEFEVQSDDVLSSELKLKLYVITQRLESKWEGLIFKGGNKATRTIFEGNLPGIESRGEIELKQFPFYDFTGEEIESFSMVQITKSGSTVGEKRLINPFPYSGRALASANHITEPEDRFDKSSNFSRLPVKTKNLTILYQFLLLGSSVAVFYWGLSNQIWVGDKTGELSVLWLFVVGGLLGGVWYVRKRALKKYLSLDASKTISLSPKPGEYYALADIVSGRAEIDIEDVNFRVVCCNRERYRILQRSHNSSTWVDAYRDFNGLVLCEKKIKRIRSGALLAEFLPKAKELCFDQMFSKLYPQAMVSQEYGISVYWEIQIIHDELVDREISVPGIKKRWPFEYFCRGS